MGYGRKMIIMGKKSKIKNDMKDNRMIDKCTWCKGDGYFGDFGPGLYPLPCPHCAGTGLEGVVSEDILKRITEIREELYNHIKSKTERLDVAAKSFEMSIRSELAENIEEAVEYEIQRQTLIQKLSAFPIDYLSVEINCLREGWERAIQLIGSPYKIIVEKNSRKIIGKTYRENAVTELENYKIRHIIDDL